MTEDRALFHWYAYLQACRWLGERNPFSWYLYSMGSLAEAYNLRKDTWVDVEAVTLKPCNWYTMSPNQAEGAIFILKDCLDMNDAGLGLFPEILRSELHGVRSVIAAHSKSQTVQRSSGPQASGILIPKTSAEHIRLLVDGVAYVITGW
jgi:hypothetical protein